MKKERNDGADRKEFNKHKLEKYSSSKSGLQALTDGKGNADDMRMGWRDEKGEIHFYGKRGFHSNEGEKPGLVSTEEDAGHTFSSKSGKNYYAAEERSKNRSDGAKHERKGVVMEKPAVEIDGVAINRERAVELEQRGVLKKGTVAEAQETQGWNRDAAKAAKEQKAAQEAKPQDKPAQEARAQKYQEVRKQEQKQEQRRNRQKEYVDDRRRKQEATLEQQHDDKKKEKIKSR